MRVEFTDTIPICPICKEPTLRRDCGGSATATYYPPIYNEKGENINPDRNKITRSFKCQKCDKHFAISGNKFDGWKYIGE